MSTTQLNKQHKVTLDWITPNCTEVIAKHARVSTKKPDRPEFARLLSYCIREGHVSIFEQACASYEIITTRSISAQLIRHRSFCFQETSQRYCDPNEILDGLVGEPDFFELREQDKKNRQNSIVYQTDEVEKKFRQKIVDTYNESHNLYRELLEAGVAKECARNILPMGTPTRLHMQGNIRNWIFYVGLRSAPGTQREHRHISNLIGRSLRQQIPSIILAVQAAAVEDNNMGLRGWRFIDST